MKSLREIQNAKLPGDYELIGKALKLSPETVKKIINGTRTDVDGKVQQAFTMLIKYREEGKPIIIKRIQRSLKLQAI